MSPHEGCTAITPPATNLRELMPADLALSMSGKDTQRIATPEAAAMAGHPLRPPMLRDWMRILLPCLPLVVAIVAFGLMAWHGLPNLRHHSKPATTTTQQHAKAKPAVQTDRSLARYVSARLADYLPYVSWLLFLTVLVTALIMKCWPAVFVVCAGSLFVLAPPPALLLVVMLWVGIAGLLVIGAGFAIIASGGRMDRFWDEQLAQVHPHVRGRVVATTRDGDVVTLVELLVPVPAERPTEQAPWHACFAFDFDARTIERVELPGWALETACEHAARRRHELDDLTVHAEHVWFEADAHRRLEEAMPETDPEVVEAQQTAALINVEDKRPGAWS